MQTHREIQAARHKIQKHKSQQIQAKIHTRKAHQTKKSWVLHFKILDHMLLKKTPNQKRKKGKKRQKTDKEFVEWHTHLSRGELPNPLCSWRSTKQSPTRQAPLSPRQPISTHWQRNWLQQHTHFKGHRAPCPEPETLISGWDYYSFIYTSTITDYCFPGPTKPWNPNLWMRYSFIHPPARIRVSLVLFLSLALLHPIASSSRSQVFSLSVCKARGAAFALEQQAWWSPASQW
jgi:hypothetical protein